MQRVRPVPQRFASVSERRPRDRMDRTREAALPKALTVVQPDHRACLEVVTLTKRRHTLARDCGSPEPAHSRDPQVHAFIRVTS
jgi:hypothetical protein